MKQEINKCTCGGTPKEVVSEMFGDCSNNYHIECPSCGNKSIVSNFSYYCQKEVQISDKQESVNDWNNKNGEALTTTPVEEQANKILAIIVKDAKEAFPEYSEEQIWDFALLVIRKTIARLKETPKQLKLDFEI